jgi:hypothetical protein
MFSFDQSHLFDDDDDDDDDGEYERLSEFDEVLAASICVCYLPQLVLRVSLSLFLNVRLFL